jgi:pimeloyl-ACP methyl ester carboxylesterase
MMRFSERAVCMGAMMLSQDSDLREGYAEIGDMRLHYVEAGEGPLIVLLHGFPEFWYGWRQQIKPLAAAGYRVVAPDMRGYNLSSKPDGVAAYDIGNLSADIRGLIRERGADSALLVGHDWGGSVAWATAMSYPDVVDRLAILNAAHPRKPAPPRPAPQVLVLFLFRSPGATRNRRPRRPLAFFPALPARRSSGLHARGDQSLCGGVVTARRCNRDDQLLPVFRADSAKARRGNASAHQCTDPGHLGPAGSLPRRRTSRA